ncbi:MAG: type II toxin-antitoxin system VapC family toxin [Pseudonocardiaceae bacterium]
MSSDLVVDANVLVDALTDDGDHGAAARAALRDSTIAGPEHLRIETFHILRVLARRGTFDADTMGLAVDHLGRLPISVVPTALLLERMWALRENLTGYDAAYVAAAEHLGVDLLTRNGALHAAPGIRCAVRVP